MLGLPCVAGGEGGMAPVGQIYNLCEKGQPDVLYAAATHFLGGVLFDRFVTFL